LESLPFPLFTFSFLVATQQQISFDRPMIFSSLLQIDKCGNTRIFLEKLIVTQIHIGVDGVIAPRSMKFVWFSNNKFQSFLKLKHK